ncbi:EamA family transporter [Mariniluteicoccus flavus]
METKSLRGSLAVTVLLTLLAPIAWGSTYVVAQTLLPPGRPLFGAVLRAVPVGLVFLLFVRRLPPRGWWGRVLILSALNIGAFFPLIYLSAYRLPSGLASTIAASSPLVVTFLAAALLSERVRARGVVGALVGLVGVGLLVLRGAVHPDPIGLAASAGAMLMSAVGFVLVKRWQPPAGLFTLTTWQLLFGGLMIVPVALAVEGAPPALTATNLAGYAYLAVFGTAIAYLAWFNGLRHLRAATVSVLGLVNPVVGTLLGVVVVGEPFGLTQAAGVALVLAGVLFATLPTLGWRRTRARAAQCEPRTT